MVKKFLILTTLISLQSAYSMDGEHAFFEAPQIEIQAPKHHRDDLTEENELARLRISASRPTTPHSDSDESDSSLGSPVTTPKKNPPLISHLYDDPGIIADETTADKFLNPEQLEKLENFKHEISFSHMNPRFNTPEPIRTNDEEIKRLTKIYEEARKALPEDLVKDVLAKDEYQTMIKAKLNAIDHSKSSSQIGNFPDQSDVIIARQEKLITYLQDKINEIPKLENKALRDAFKGSTEMLIADLKKNLTSSKIKDAIELGRAKVLLEHIEEDQAAIENLLLSDPNFEAKMGAHSIRINENSQRFRAII